LEKGIAPKAWAVFSLRLPDATGHGNGEQSARQRRAFASAFIAGFLRRACSPSRHRNEPSLVLTTKSS
jgi:hypothetical protein